MSDKNSPLILGTAKIGKLLLQYSIPAIIAMTVTSIYNIVDSIFIGHGVGALGISGLAITFPLMNLIAAFCTLVGVGGASITSIRLGQKDTEGASAVLGNVLVLGIINGVLFGAITWIFLEPILRFFGASDATLPYAKGFMEVLLLGNPILYTLIGMNNMLRATGYPNKAMISALFTVGANIILAPIFIFYLNWGIRGAAFATVLSQAGGMVWALSHFTRKDSFIHFQPGIYRLKKRIIFSIFSIGMSPFLMNVCASFVVIIINNSLKTYGGDMAIGAYGIINRVLTLFVMVVMGLTMGMQPIVGYNYGARQYDRVRMTLKKGIITGVSITTFGCIISEIFPGIIVKMFTTHTELSELARTGLRIACLMFPLVGCQIVISNFFQSIGKAKISIFLSLSRQLLFLIPCLLILPRFMGVNGVWTSIPVADSIAFVIALITLLTHLKKLGTARDTVI